MRTMLTLIFLTVLLTCGLAQAQSHWDEDVIGVYFDSQWFIRELWPQAGTLFPAYVVLSNPTSLEIHGFEFGYEIVVAPSSEGSFFRLGATLPPQNIDLGTSTDRFSGDYVVGLGTPLVSNAHVVLLTWEFMLLTNFGVSIFLGPSHIESIPDGYPAYEIGGSIRPMAPDGGLGNMQACINSNCIVGVEESSFGAVKALYR